MLCSGCTSQPHSQTDCHYPVSCPCQHRLVAADGTPTDEVADPLNVFYRWANTIVKPDHVRK